MPQEQKKSIIEDCVLVAPDNQGQEIEIVDMDVMTAVVEDYSDIAEMNKRISLTGQVQRIKSKKIIFASKTLISLLVQTALGDDYLLAQQFSHHDYVFVKE